MYTVCETVLQYVYSMSYCIPVCWLTCTYSQLVAVRTHLHIKHTGFKLCAEISLYVDFVSPTRQLAFLKISSPALSILARTWMYAYAYAYLYACVHVHVHMWQLAFLKISPTALKIIARTWMYAHAYAYLYARVRVHIRIYTCLYELSSGQHVNTGLNSHVCV